MVSVLGPIESLEKLIGAVVENSDIEGLDVVVNPECSIQKFIRDNEGYLPRNVSTYAIGKGDIAVCGDTTEEYSSFFGLIRGTRPARKTVVALVYPYHPNCVVVVDNKYGELGEHIREVISRFSHRAVPIF